MNEKLEKIFKSIDNGLCIHSKTNKIYKDIRNDNRIDFCEKPYIEFNGKKYMLHNNFNIDYQRYMAQTIYRTQTDLEPNKSEQEKIDYINYILHDNFFSFIENNLIYEEK